MEFLYLVVSQSRILISCWCSGVYFMWFSVDTVKVGVYLPLLRSLYLLSLLLCSWLPTAASNRLPTWNLVLAVPGQVGPKSSSSLCLGQCLPKQILLSYSLRKRSRFVKILPTFNVSFLFSLACLKILSLCLQSLKKLTSWFAF